jgi:hypothetical protein
VAGRSERVTLALHGDLICGRICAIIFRMSEELKEFILERFRRADEKLDRVLDVLIDLCDRVGLVEQRVGLAEQRTARIEQRLGGIETRIERIEVRLGLVEV